MCLGCDIVMHETATVGDLNLQKKRRRLIHSDLLQVTREIMANWGDCEVKDEVKQQDGIDVEAAFTCML